MKIRFTTHLCDGDLTHLAARDLPLPQLEKMRRHLDGCKACQAQWENLQTVWQPLPFDNFAPDPLRERIYAAFPVPRPERKMMPTSSLRPTVVGASLAAAAVAAISVTTLLGSALVFRAPRAVAFADVEAAMAGIKNATWTQTITATIGAPTKLNKPHTERILSDNFMQADPPRITARWQDLSSEKPEKALKRTVFYGKYALSFSENRRNYHQFEGDTPGWVQGSNGAEMVRRAVLFPREMMNSTTSHNTTSRITQKVTATVEQGPWTSAPDTLDGKAVVRLQSRTTTRFMPSPHRPKPTSEFTENTVWVDPKSYRIVRRETHTPPQHQTNLDIKADIKIVCDNYHYNVALPHGIFEVPVPPVGQPFLFYNYPQATKNNWSVSPQDTAKIKAVIERAAQQWSQKRADDFVQSCDFGFNAIWAELWQGKRTAPAQILENKQQWARRVQKGVPYRSWKLQSLTVAKQMGGGVYVREKASDSFPPTGRPINYSATCLVLAQLKPGAKPVPCSVTVTLRRVGDDFRITYLNMYSRDMGMGNGIAWRPKPKGEK